MHFNGRLPLLCSRTGYYRLTFTLTGRQLQPKTVYFIRILHRYCQPKRRELSKYDNLYIRYSANSAGLRKVAHRDVMLGSSMKAVNRMAEDRSALVIFVDVRGFTRWSEANEIFINLEEFVVGFLDILRRRFESDFQVKPLGDGALLVSLLPEHQASREMQNLLGHTLANINRVEKEFNKHCGDFARRVGHAASLNLGWGIVRGKIIRVGDDWAGHNLNKCSRLCSEARPFGVVIDRDDFPTLPREARGLVAQIRRLRGIGDVPVWVSAEISNQFVPRERLRESPEVHVAGTCFTEDRNGSIRILLARRSMDRQLFPGKLEGCGGQLRYSETFTEGVQRHFRLEFGIDVEVLPSFHCFYEIREANAPVIPGIRFLCKKIGDNQPSSVNHSDLQWTSEQEFRQIPAQNFVGGLKGEVIDLLEKYRES